MKKSIGWIYLLVLISVSSINCLAGQWKQNEFGWWYDEGDGNYPQNSWEWIDGNGDGVAECYYFNQEGYMFNESVTADGFQLNSEGQWIVDGQVQTKILKNISEASDTLYQKRKEFFYERYPYHAELTDMAIDILCKTRAEIRETYGIVRDTEYQKQEDGSVLIIGGYTLLENGIRVFFESECEDDLPIYIWADDNTLLLSKVQINILEAPTFDDLQQYFTLLQYYRWRIDYGNADLQKKSFYLYKGNYIRYDMPQVKIIYHLDDISQNLLEINTREIKHYNDTELKQ